ncbi:molecular chaperone [Sesbania bispinosa]|nr:molecular chaperone [Sesbania bispinosa]
MTNPEKDQSAPPATTNLHDSPPRPAQREIGGSSSRGHQSRPVPPPPETRHGQRTPTTFIGTTFKARWQPKQTRIMVAEQLNKYQIPPLGDIINFLDPAGKVHHIAIKLHDGRQWFEDGLLQMMEYYDLWSYTTMRTIIRIEKHCRFGQGYYQYCRQATLNHGDELTCWKIIGAPHYGLQVKRQRE